MLARKVKLSLESIGWVVVVLAVIAFIGWYVIALRQSSGRIRSEQASGQTACGLLSVAEAEGVMRIALREVKSNSSGASAVTTCDYRAEDSSDPRVVSLVVERDADEATAGRVYREARENEGEVETITDIGNEAYYADGLQRLRFRQGSRVVTVRTGEPGDGQAREWSLGVARIVSGHL